MRTAALRFGPMLRDDPLTLAAGLTEVSLGTRSIATRERLNLTEEID